jgi:hypothetical protein
VKVVGKWNQASGKSWKGLRRGLTPEAGNRHLLKSQWHFSLQKVEVFSAKINGKGETGYLKLKEKRAPVKPNDKATAFEMIFLAVSPMRASPLGIKQPLLI